MLSIYGRFYSTELNNREYYEVHFITSNIPLEYVNLYLILVSSVEKYAVFQYPPYDITLSTKI